MEQVCKRASKRPKRTIRTIWLIVSVQLTSIHITNITRSERKKTACTICIHTLSLSLSLAEFYSSAKEKSVAVASLCLYIKHSFEALCSSEFVVLLAMPLLLLLSQIDKMNRFSFVSEHEKHRQPTHINTHTNL